MQLKIKNPEDHGVAFKYSFSSILGLDSQSVYIKDVTQKIILIDEYGNDIEDIGYINFSIIHVNQARFSSFGLFEVLDSQGEYIRRHMFNLFDMKTGEYKKAIENAFDIYKDDMCFIREVLVKPKYRGIQLGAKAIKDLIFHYSSSCDFFVLQPFPLQHEAGSDNEYKDYELENLEKNIDIAEKKILSYYVSIGFESIKGIKDLLFYDPTLVNEKFDAIDMYSEPFGEE